MHPSPFATKKMRQCPKCDHFYVLFSLSSYVNFDIIKRILTKYFRINVVNLLNITDIDDKIIRKSIQVNEREISSRERKILFCLLSIQSFIFKMCFFLCRRKRTSARSPRSTRKSSLATWPAWTASDRRLYCALRDMCQTLFPLCNVWSTRIWPTQLARAAFISTRSVSPSTLSSCQARRARSSTQKVIALSCMIFNMKLRCSVP